MAAWPVAPSQPEDDSLLLGGFAEIEEREIGEQAYRKYLNWARLWGPDVIRGDN